MVGIYGGLEISSIGPQITLSALPGGNVGQGKENCRKLMLVLDTPQTDRKKPNEDPGQPLGPVDRIREKPRHKGMAAGQRRTKTSRINE